MLRRIADTPVWLRLMVAIWLMLVVAWSGMIAWAARQHERTVVNQAREFAQSVHQMTLAGLTGMMLTGTIDRREVFLDQIRNSSDIEALRVVRSEAVAKTFGEGRADEHPADADEREVLTSGRPYESIAGDSLHVVLPVFAARNYLGKDCLMCHQVPEGTVLGAVTMRISLKKVSNWVRDHSLRLFGTAVLISAPLLLFIYLFITRFVTRPLDRMTEGMRAVAAGEGDLTRKLTVRSRDEIGRAAEGFNEVMETIGRLVRQVKESADAVGVLSRELGGDAEQVLAGSHRQFENSRAVAGAADDMAGRIDSVVAQTEAVRRLSELTLQRTDEGDSSLGQLVDELERAEQAVGAMAQTVTAFIRSSDSINGMTMQVKSIADQTNLLALNAAIEAARAGDTGRGFAVVADEVRTLAQRSAQSADEITRLTETMAGQSREVERAVARGLEHLQKTREPKAQVEAILADAKQAAARVGDGMAGIAAAAREQQSGAEVVTRNVEAITGSARDNETAVAQVASKVAELEHLARSLAAEVGRFRV